MPGVGDKGAARPAGGTAQRTPQRQGTSGRQMGQNRPATAPKSPSSRKTAGARTPAGYPVTQPDFTANSTRPQARRLTNNEMRRRRRRRTIWLALLALILVAAGVVFSVTVLFQIKSFRVENLDKTTPADTGIYTEEAILSALQLSEGDNLFAFSASQKEEQLLAALPYLETINIRRSLPSTLVVQVAPAVETWAAPSQAGWLTLSEGLNIMKVDPEQPNLPQIQGLQVEKAAAGFPLRTSDENQLALLQKMLELLKTYELYDQLSAINLEDSNELYFVLEDRAMVLLGTSNQLEYKLQFAAHILHNKDGKGVDSSEIGRLDVSHMMEDGTLQPVWTPGALESFIPAQGAQMPAPGDTSQPEANSGSEQTEPGTEGQTASPSPDATDAPQGTDTPQATATPGTEASPTPQLSPTATPEPTATPKPHTPTPQPGAGVGA